MKIGFIGQGWIGKNYADNYENRGFSTVRYAKEESYKHNKELLEECDIIFIAVPTPTTATGFEGSVVWEVMGLIPKGKIAVIKSTLIPGTTRKLQEAHPHIIVLHSPEFLTETTVKRDVDSPSRNIIGVPQDTPAHREAAKKVMKTLPLAPYSLVCNSHESEFIKYVNNSFFYTKVVYMNLLYDLAEKLGVDWKVVRDAAANEPMIGPFHLDPVHKSGRGAAGDCLLKDYAALKRLYEEHVDDPHGRALLAALEKKNLHLLVTSEKDLHIIKGVYGDIPDVSQP